MPHEESQAVSVKPRRFVRWLRYIAYLCLCVALIAGSLFVYAKRKVTAFTSERPASLPAVKVSKDRMVALEKRIGSITHHVESGAKLQSDFLLTPEEINALIHKDAKLRDKVFIKIVDGVLKADVSFPADVLPGGEGRYFNAEVSLSISVVDGVLKLMISQALVDGEPVPDVWMRLVRDRDFAKPLYNDREISQILANVDDVQIQEDGIVFHLRGTANERQIVFQARRPNRRVRVQ